MDIIKWCNELHIPDNEEVLISFTWCQDDKKRKFLMFPEFISVDMTFGVNKQRRNLVTCVGVDGNHKIFTGFCSWMPSNQHFAYDWVISCALPTCKGYQSISCT